MKNFKEFKQTYADKKQAVLDANIFLRHKEREYFWETKEARELVETYGEYLKNMENTVFEVKLLDVIDEIAKLWREQTPTVTAKMSKVFDTQTYARITLGNMMSGMRSRDDKIIIDITGKDYKHKMRIEQPFNPTEIQQDNLPLHQHMELKQEKIFKRADGNWMPTYRYVIDDYSVMTLKYKYFQLLHSNVSNMNPTLLEALNNVIDREYGKYESEDVMGDE